ncbi:MAG: D-ribose pyranase [Candidatus Methanomethylicaceae archaeon]
MRRGQIINTQMLWALGTLGHGDRIAIADCGLPIPKGVWRIDVAVIRGIPAFQDVVKAIVSEMIVQKGIIAEEMRKKNPKQYDFIQEVLKGIPIEEVPHVKFKELLRDVKAVIRTGEATPYSNVILEAGVDF